MVPAICSIIFIVVFFAFVHFSLQPQKEDKQKEVTNKSTEGSEKAKEEKKGCFNYKVVDVSNEDSWKAAKENAKVARPFAIYCPPHECPYPPPVCGYILRWEAGAAPW